MPKNTKKFSKIKIIRGKEYYPIKICGLTRNLPLFEVSPGIKIAIFNILGDVKIVVKAAKALVKRLPKKVDVIVTAEVKSVPLAYEIARLMKAPYVVLRKIYKPYMVGAVRSETLSITTGKKQEIWLDGRDLNLLKGKKVVIVDDVVSTGSTLKGMREVIKKAGGKIIAEAAVFTEGKGWKRFICLGNLPVFKNP